VVGTFLEIDIDAKEPAFKIHSPEEDYTIKGKLKASILEKIKSDFVNIGRETYKFTVMTIYHPETTVKAQDIKRYLIDYKKKQPDINRNKSTVTYEILSPKLSPI
jgi:hypothetical protein